MAEKFNFTNERIKRADCEKGKAQTIYWDADTKGLGLKVTANGNKTFIFEGRLDSKLRIKIADVEAKGWTIEKARMQAQGYQVQINQGIDPRQDKKRRIKEQQEEREKEATKTATVLDAWTEYIEYQKDKMTRHNLERGKKWGERHLLDHERMTQPGGQPKVKGKGKTKPGVLLPLMKVRLSEIGPDMLANWVAEESKTRANTARQAFEAFRAFWRWCAGHKDFKPVVNIEAVEDKELRDHVPSRKTKGMHEDVLEAQQLQVWFESVRGLSNPVLAAYLQGLLITGARREELAHLKWTDIEFQWNSMFLHDKVDGTGERKVPLTPYFRHLIESLPRRNEWVFSSPSSESGRITEPRIAHNRALNKAGLPHLTLHGLRRSFLTLSEWVEMPQGIVSQIAGHKPSATAERHYKRRPLDLLALWHIKFEAWFLDRAEVEFNSSSVPRLKAVS